MNTELNNRVSIYVPSTTDGNKPAKRLQKKVTKHTARVFSRIFGGATAYKARGYWNSSEKGLIAEEQNIIFSACTEADREKNTARVFSLAKFICKYMKQEAVTVEINNTLYFVEA